MRFPPHLLDDIRARLPVSQVVSRRVALKKAGREWRGLSPFKTERTPSFFVNDQKGFYHCFASGEHGDIFKFVMATEGVSFPEAVERLAAEAGVPMPKEAQAPEARQRQDQRTHLMDLLAASAAFFESNLAGPQGSEARRYLEKRGLARETLATFRIGFAPAGRTALKEHLAAKGFKIDDMILSGMLIGGEDIAVPYDRFRNRVMFPICDLKGRPIAFGGRALDPDAPAKYLNSPETPLFHKGAVLFNAHRARATAFETGKVLAVEGYMDVVALTEAGITNAVAPLGTALTHDQVRLLWRMSPEPTLCFDGDAAGRKAAWRAIDTVLPHLAPGTSVSFAFLPDGLDPDDLVRQGGRGAVDDVLAAARPLADVLWDREWSGGDWSTPERRALLEKRLAGLIGQIADVSVRGHYQQDMRARLAKIWGEVSAAGHRRPGGKAPFTRPAWPRTGPAVGPQTAAKGAFSSAGARGRAMGNGQAFGGISPGLRSSPLAQGGSLAVPSREALIMRAILNHPWLIDLDWERIASLSFASAPLQRLRNAILEVHASHNPLDRTTLQTQLTNLGLDKVVDLVERAVTHKSDKFAEPDADVAQVEVGWRDAISLHERQVGLRRALEAAERAWHDDGSAEAFARICDIRQQLNVADVLEDVHD
jgi:DNA primase